MAALGICLSVLVWSSAAALGLNLLLAQAPVLQGALKFLGAGYLILLGLRLLRGAFMAGDATAPANPALRDGQAVRSGFLVNIGNPKTIAYYTSVFAVLVPVAAAPLAFAEIVATALAVSTAWWLSVAIIFSHPIVSRAFLRIKRLLDTIAGGFLIFFGIRLAEE